MYSLASNLKELMNEEHTVVMAFENLRMSELISSDNYATTLLSVALELVPSDSYSLSLSLLYSQRAVYR